MAETLNLGGNTSVKVNWKNRSFYDIRRSPRVVADLESRGRRIAAAANKTLAENRLGNKVRDRRVRSVGYRMSSFQGKRKPQGRHFVQVYTASNHAKYSEAKHNTLIRVLNDTQNINATSLTDYTP
jgi:hypothetical protein